MNRIFVIGGTGNVGRQVLSQLASTGEPVRALSRNPSAAQFPPGIDTVQGDLTRPESLCACLDGIDTVFLVWTAPSSAVAPALECIAARVRRIVFLSSPYNVPHPFFQRPQPNGMAATQAEIERIIQASPLSWIFLRPSIFAGNTVAWWRTRILASNLVRWPYAFARTAPIDERDIASVAVQALLPGTHSRAEYVITGPQALTQAGQLSTIGAALGRPLRMEEISPEDARRELVSVMPAFVIDMLLRAWEGAMSEPPLVTTTVADVTGSPARTFAQWATENAAAFLP